jgi:hypothetical protein
MKLLFFVVLLVLAAANTFPAGRRKVQDGQESSAVPAADIPDRVLETGDQADVAVNEVNDIKKIVGQVQIYGSEPHTFAGILDENGVEYSIYPPEKEKEIRSLQGHLIEFTVVVLEEPRGFGSLFLKGGAVTPVEWKILDE